MSKARIHNLIEQLQQEIEQTDSLESAKKQKLETLVSDIESGLNDEKLPDQLNDNLSETVTEFEASYPRLTAIVNDIMVTLSNLGI